MAVTSGVADGIATNADGDWIDGLARLGHAAKGVVYGVIGLLAIQAAFGTGGSTEGSKGAIREIAQQPFGTVLLIVLSVGLAAYVLWRLSQAFLDVDDKGKDVKGLIRRSAYFVSAVTYGSLAFFSMKIVLGSGSSGSSSKESMAAAVLGSTLGRVAFVAAGVAILGAAAYQAYQAWTAKFMERYTADDMDRRARDIAKRTGQLGHGSRALIFAVIGFFVIQGGLQSDASDAKGLGEALGSLASQPYGPYLLGVVSAGLICYAVYCFFRVRYQRYEG